MHSGRVTSSATLRGGVTSAVETGRNLEAAQHSELNFIATTILLSYDQSCLILYKDNCMNSQPELRFVRAITTRMDVLL